MFINSLILYCTGVIKSNRKRSFEELGRVFCTSGDTIARLLLHCCQENIEKLLLCIAKKVFKNKEHLVFAIDDTLISKIHSSQIRGTCFFYDNKIGKMIRSFKLLVGSLTDGNYAIPLNFSFLLSKEYEPNATSIKDEILHTMILKIVSEFPDKIITFSLDGAFASVRLLTWFVEQKLRVEIRMHKNRKVLYKGNMVKINEIEELHPNGRHQAKTIQIVWHGLKLWLTGERRINKKSEETIVFLISTYQARPLAHVQNYKKRWVQEEIFRTTKQTFGLNDCSSTNKTKQLNYCGVILATYAFLELYKKQTGKKYQSVEEAYRSIKARKTDSIKSLLQRLSLIFESS